MLPAAATTAPPERQPAVLGLRGLLLGALPLVLLVLFRGSVPLELPASIYLPAHTATELLVTAVALATFSTQWFAAGASGFEEARARFLGSALLAVGAFEALHFLSFPGMPGLFGPGTTERGITYWLAARVWTVGALLAALAIQPGSRSPALGRFPLLLANGAAVAAVIALDVLLPHDRAFFFVEGKGLTALKQAIEGGVVLAAAVGAILYARAARRAGDRALGWLAAALGLTALAEVCFALYATAYDAFNLLGHLYLVASFWFLFNALFRATLLRPFRELHALRAHVEGELAETITRLRHRTEQRDDLLRAVSHDLRNPLQVVLLQAQRLLRAEEDERRRRPAETILTAGRRMERMLRDLVDSARLEAGTLALAPRPLALQPFVAELLRVSEGAMEVRRVVNAVPADLPALSADPDRLERIVSNLIGNALKYTQGEVRVGAERAGDEVRIWVADQGPGIAPEELPRLFERYYRGRAPTGDGLGLGLYIVRKLVEAHGGRIDVESAPAKGTVFSFTLRFAPTA